MQTLNVRCHQLLMGLTALSYRLRHILSALYNVADRFDETAIRSVLRELTPGACRIMWASKTHEVRRLRVSPLRSSLTKLA